MKLTVNKKTKYIFQCSLCPRIANLLESQRALDGWQVSPRVICSSCNGNDSASYLRIPATEKGKFYLARKYEDS